MRKLLAFAFILCATILFSVGTRAGTTNLLNLTTVNGTANGSVFSVSGIYIPPQKFLFQNLGITNQLSGSFTTNGVTNCIMINVQVSVDAANSNWVTLATYVPSGTNSTVDEFKPQFNSITLPMRCQVVTSNGLGVATFVQQ